MKPSLLAIYITPVSAAPMKEVSEVCAIEGRGLEGDRYADGKGKWTKAGAPDRHVTLIEAEALEALKRDYEIELPAGETRRNLLTQGVPLNHLVGKKFRVGEAELKGIKLCEPCSHLDKLAGKRVSKGLAHRGGLRAQIVTGGVIKAGDEILVLE